MIVTVVSAPTIAGQPYQENPSYFPATLKQELQNLIEQGMSRSQASRHLVDVTQLPRRQLYQLTLEQYSDMPLIDMSRK